MNHEEAIGGMLTEKYLLGELTGRARGEFEDHLFTCAECAKDVQAGVSMLEAARLDLRVQPKTVTGVREEPRSAWWRAWLSPVWLAPVLAACVAVVVYQNVVQLPGLKKELAEANAPEVLNSVMLTGGGARGGADATAIAKNGGAFLLSVDIPPVGAYEAYRCTLTAPSGKTVWQGAVSREQAKDAILVRIPAASTEAGTNRLVIEGVRHENGVLAKPETIATRTFELVIIK